MRFAICRLFGLEYARLNVTKVHYSGLDDKYWIRDGDNILWFDSSLDAKDAARQLEIDAAVKAERAKIVAWLLADEDPYPDAYDIADAIEAGEHLK